MGVGDEVPAAITQLGATVHLLSDVELASGDLARFDTIITGTRAYAVRADLHAHNDRLLAFVKAGGNLVVLYNIARVHAGNAGALPGIAAGRCGGSVRGRSCRRDPDPSRPVAAAAEPDWTL